MPLPSISKLIEGTFKKEAEVMKVQGEGKKKRKLASRKPLLHELDEAVLDYLMDERASGRPVSNKGLCRKSLELAKHHHSF